MCRQLKKVKILLRKRKSSHPIFQKHAVLRLFQMLKRTRKQTLRAYPPSSLRTRCLTTSRSSRARKSAFKSHLTDSTIKSSLFRQSTKRLPSRFWSNAVRKRSASSAFSVPMRQTKTSAIPKSRAAIMSASRKGRLSFKACLAKGLPSNQKLLPPLFSVQFFCF